MSVELLPDDRRALLALMLGGHDLGPAQAEDRGRTLLARLLLPRVRKVYLETANPWPEDAETLVHESRVASRRLVETLELLCPAVGRARAKDAQRRAKALRQALGASREADVLVADFRALTHNAGMGEETVHALDAMTEHGQGALQAAKENYPPERLLQYGVDVLRLAATPTTAAPLSALAGPHLYARVEAAAPLVETLHDPEQSPAHHRLRIRVKHLRYTAELLGESFEAAFDAKATIGRLKTLQDALGVLNDAQDLLAWLKRPALKKALGKKTCKKVRKLADELRLSRYGFAKVVVLEQAPLLFADLRRAAGVIGPIGA